MRGSVLVEWQCANTHDKDTHEKEIDENLHSAAAYRLKQQVSLVDEREKLEDTEYAYESERTEDKHITCGRENYSQIWRENSKQVYRTEEASSILPA